MSVSIIDAQGPVPTPLSSGAEIAINHRRPAAGCKSQDETNNNPWISFLNLMAMFLSPFRRS
jgi:hypothetical protein